MTGMRTKLTGAFVVLLLFTASATTAIAQENPNKAIDLNVLAARGEALANQDPLSAELRSRQPDDPSRRGFDIGMAAAEGQTLPGPGKQRLGASLPQAEQRGFNIAVSFSLERNRNADLAAKGAAIATVDGRVAAARTADGDVFYWLGFDIATGIFGDPALGANGNTATGPGSLKIRDSLSPAGQRGFNASVKLHLGQAPPSSTPERRPRSSGEVISIDNYGKRDKAFDKVYDDFKNPAAGQVTKGKDLGAEKSNAVFPNPSKRLIISAEGSYGFQPVPSGKINLGQTIDGEIWLALSYEDGTPFTQARAGDIHIEALSRGNVARLDPSLSRASDGVWHFILPQIDSGSHFYLISVVVDIKAWRATYEGRTIVRATYTRMPFWNAQRVDGTIWQPPE